MFQKTLALCLAAAMMMSMSLSVSAKTITRKSDATQTTQEEPSTPKVIKKKSESSTGTAAADGSAPKASASSGRYDFCPSQLGSLGDTLHDAFVSGLRNLEDTIVVDVSGHSQSQLASAFQSAVQIIIEQHAEIFWLDTSMQNFVTTSDGKLVFYPRPAAAYGTAHANGTGPSQLNTTAIRNTTAKMDAIAASITGNTRYDLVKGIHDYIVNHAEYYAGSQDKQSFHEANGVLLEGTGVCDGYAKAFKYLADKKGVPCLVVGGTASNAAGQSGTHAWNYVQMEDGQWYNIDTGWDDPVVASGGSNAQYNYVYFLNNNVKDTRVKDGYRYPALSPTDYAA